jgi:hypothetical protein
LKADRLLTEGGFGGSLAGLSVDDTFNGCLQRDSVSIKNGSTALQGSNRRPSSFLCSIDRQTV